VVSSDEGLTLEYPGGAQEEFAFIGNSADVVDDGYEEELADSPATDEPCDTHGDGSPWDCGPLA